MAFKAMAPQLTACGGDRMDFLGYDSEGHPVAAYG